MPIPGDPVDAKPPVSSKSDDSEPGNVFDRGAKNRTGISSRGWSRNIIGACKAYDDWADDYAVSLLEDLFRGHHYNTRADAENKYTGNLVFAAIRANMPSLLFYHPHFKVAPLPPFIDDTGTKTEERFKLLEDTVNTVMSDRRMQFQAQAELALLDSYFRFGILMAGWSADYLENPNAGQPIIEDDQDNDPEAKVPEGEQKLKPLRQPKLVPTNERVFTKHIPARQFRVGIECRPLLSDNEWCGYWEWATLADVKANKAYNESARRRVKASAAWKYEGEAFSSLDVDKLEESDKSESGYRSKMVLLWHVWHIRSKSRFVMAEGYNGFLLEPEEYKIFPFSDLRPAPDPGEFYPIPPTYNWLSPQNERNAIMTGIRTHRQRAKRRWTFDPTKIKPEQVKKLESEEDFAYCEREAGAPADCLAPVADAPLDPNVSNGWLQQVTQDFQQVSGIGSESRGVSAGGTATAAAIIDSRSQVRESFARAQVSSWLSRIGTIVTQILVEYATAPLWVKLNVDMQGAEAGTEITRVIGMWREIQVDGEDEAFDRLNYEVEVDVNSITPVTRDAEKADWIQVVGLMTNPTAIALFVGSPFILRKTLSFFNITAAQTLAEIQASMERVLQTMQAQAAGTQGGEGQGAAPGGPSGTPASGGGPQASSAPQAAILNRVSNAAAAMAPGVPRA